jgi:hypothetical protein
MPTKLESQSANPSEAAHDRAWEQSFVRPIARIMKQRGIGYMVIVLRENGQAAYVLDPTPPDTGAGTVAHGLVTPRMVRAALDQHVQYMVPVSNIETPYHIDVHNALQGVADHINEALNDSMAGTGIARATEAARKWCRENPGWQAICDMESTDHLYMRWQDLSKGAKLAWRNRYGKSAEDAYAEATHSCKVANGFVDENGNFTHHAPFGVVGMMVFHCSNDQEMATPR